MNRTAEEIRRMRKAFFNERAEGWIDAWYRDPATGRMDRHEKDFERLFSILPLGPGDVVLDAGCGTGVLVPFILERIAGTGTLYELDYAEKMIETNRRLHDAGNVRFIVAEAEEAPLEEGSCDAVICFSCFPHFHDKGKALETLSRILRPGGSLAVAHFDSSEGIDRHHGSCRAVMHDVLPKESEMRSLFGEASLEIKVFIDEPGFYCVIAFAPTPRPASGSLPGWPGQPVI